MLLTVLRAQSLTEEPTAQKRLLRTHNSFCSRTTRSQTRAKAVLAAVLGNGGSITQQPGAFRPRVADLQQGPRRSSRVKRSPALVLALLLLQWDKWG